MNRAAVCALLAACKATSSSPPPPPSGSSAVVAAADAVWTGTDGDVLVRAHGGVVDGACGRLGTVSGTTLTYAGGTVSFAALTAKDGVYTLPGMSFHVEVAPSGAVTAVYSDGARVPSGAIAGAPPETTIEAMLAARLLAPPPKLALADDGAPLFHYDDGRVADARDHVLYDERPPIDDPFWVAADAKVVRSGDHFDVDLVAPRNSYRALHYLREHDLPEPASPPPPPPRRN